MAETAAAVRLSLASFAVAVVTYFACGLLVRPDARFVRLGMRDEYEFVLRDADAVVHGPRPVAWLVGSSVVRESFDADAIGRDLRAVGVDLDVQKFAFDRGTPLFTRPLLRHLPIHPGDRVLTSVAEDNFTVGWIHEADDLSGPARFLLDPIDAWTLPDLGARERADLLVAMLPPRSFHRYRDDFVRGCVEWASARWEGRPERALANVDRQPFTRGAVQRLRPPDVLERRIVTDDGLLLDPSQENWAALLGWIDDVRALGAVPVVIVVPHHPDYGLHFVSDEGAARVRAAVDGLGVSVWRLDPAGRDAYADWNHPNDAGRAIYTRQLVERLAGAAVPASPG